MVFLRRPEQFAERETFGTNWWVRHVGEADSAFTYHYGREIRTALASREPKPLDIIVHTGLAFERRADQRSVKTR